MAIAQPGLRELLAAKTPESPWNRMQHEAMLAMQAADAAKGRQGEQLAAEKEMERTREANKIKVAQIAHNGLAKLAGQAPKEAKDYNKLVSEAYKPLNSQIDATRATLENLDLKSTVGDKAAIINEARMLGGAAGSHALQGIIRVMAPSKDTANMKFDDMINFINNSPEKSVMPDSMRESYRKFALDRLAGLEAQHQAYTKDLAAKGAVLAPHADYQSILNTEAGAFQTKLDYLRKGQQDRAKAAALAPQGAPEAAVGQTNLDKVKQFGANLASKENWDRAAATVKSQTPQTPEEFSQYLGVGGPMAIPGAAGAVSRGAQGALLGAGGLAKAGVGKLAEKAMGIPSGLMSLLKGAAAAGERSAPEAIAASAPAVEGGLGALLKSAPAAESAALGAAAPAEGEALKAFLASPVGQAVLKQQRVR